MQKKQNKDSRKKFARKHFSPFTQRDVPAILSFVPSRKAALRMLRFHRIWRAKEII